MSAVEYIAGTTLTTTATTVTFSGISGNYTDLTLVCGGLGLNGNTNGFSILRYNQDTATNYSRTLLSGNGSAASSGRVSNETSHFPGSGTGASNPTLSVLHILSYSSTSVFKTSLEMSKNDASGATIRLNVFLYRSTSAITRIDLIAPGVDQYLAGSTFSLWGVK